MSVMLLGALTAITVLVLGALLIVLWLGFQNTRHQSQLRARVAPGQSSDASGVQDDGTPAPRLMHRMARSGKAIEGWVDPENESARLMVQAGWRSAQARMAWYGFQGSVPVVGVAVVMAYWLLGPESPQKMIFLLMLGFVAFALSMLIPRWVLRSAAEGRRNRINGEVPLLVHLLVLLFEAGLSTRQAIASLVREGGGVLPQLGGEFTIVLRSIDAGADTAESLKALSDLMAIESLTSVLAVVRQVDRFGGEIKEPLLETLAVLEERRSLELREKVNLLSGRMTVVMVLFFFPALLIFVAGPAFISIIEALADVTG
jgi:tight adherence protein C